MSQGDGLCSILRAFKTKDGARPGGWKEQTVLLGHRGVVSSAEWSLDGRLVITTSTDKTARLWTANDGILRLVVASSRGGYANGHGQPTTNSKVSAIDMLKIIWILKIVCIICNPLCTFVSQ